MFTLEKEKVQEREKRAREGQREDSFLFLILCGELIFSPCFSSLLNEWADRFLTHVVYIKRAFPEKTATHNQIYQGMCASDLAEILCRKILKDELCKNRLSSCQIREYLNHLFP